MMKRFLTLLLCAGSLLVLVVGCTGVESSDTPKANSGVIDENYVGDPDPFLAENFKQTPKEAEALEKLLEEINPNEVLGEGGLSTY